MIKNGRELTCKGVYHVMDEIKNVCLTQEEDYGYIVLMVNSYDDIKNNSPISEDEEYPDLVVLGNEDGSEAYIDEDGCLHYGEDEDWRVIEVKSSCTLSSKQMEMLFPKEYNAMLDTDVTMQELDKGFLVYDTPSGKRFFEFKA